MRHRRGMKKKQKLCTQHGFALSQFELKHRGVKMPKLNTQTDTCSFIFVLTVRKKLKINK